MIHESESKNGRYFDKTYDTALLTKNANKTLVLRNLKKKISVSH